MRPLTVGAVARSVARRAVQRPGAVFVLDADCTLVRPVARMRDALGRVAEDGLPRLRSATVQALLPGLHPRGWSEFVRFHQLEREYPARNWAVVEAAWRRFLAWDGVALRTDEPAPGAGALVQALRQAGVDPVVVTGRPQWMREETAESLADLGLDVEVHCAQRGRGSTAAGKAAVVAEIARVRPVLGGIDDELDNLLALREVLPAGLWLHQEPRTFTRDPRAGGHGIRRMDFEAAVA